MSCENSLVNSSFVTYAEYMGPFLNYKLRHRRAPLEGTNRTRGWQEHAQDTLQHESTIYNPSGMQLGRCIMLFLFFIHSQLSARARPVPALDISISSTSSSCKDIDNCRTLLDIIWSCITTIFLCTWVAIHPNLPEPVDTQYMDLWPKCVHRISCFFRNKLVLFICALLVPEYILAWAIRQRLMARKIVNKNGT
jgi:hypothetical protein